MNEAINDVVEKIKSTAATAGAVAEKAAEATAKKTAELVKLSKINLRMFELNREIEDLFEKIGRVVYAAHLNPEADTGGLDEILALIDEKSTELEELRNRAIELKNGVSCGKCGVMVDKKYKYCPHCGAEI